MTLYEDYYHYWSLEVDNLDMVIDLTKMMVNSALEKLNDGEIVKTDICTYQILRKNT